MQERNIESSTEKRSVGVAHSASSGIGEALALGGPARPSSHSERQARILLETLRSRLPQPEDVLVLPLDLNQPDTFEAATEKAPLGRPHRLDDPQRWA